MPKCLDKTQKHARKNEENRRMASETKITTAPARFPFPYAGVFFAFEMNMPTDPTSLRLWLAQRGPAFRAWVNTDLPPDFLAGDQHALVYPPLPELDTDATRTQWEAGWLALEIVKASKIAVAAGQPYQGEFEAIVGPVAAALLARLHPGNPQQYYNWLWNSTPPTNALVEPLPRGVVPTYVQTENHTRENLVPIAGPAAGEGPREEPNTYLVRTTLPRAAPPRGMAASASAPSPAAYYCGDLQAAWEEAAHAGSVRKCQRKYFEETRPVRLIGWHDGQGRDAAGGVAPRPRNEDLNVDLSTVVSLASRPAMHHHTDLDADIRVLRERVAMATEKRRELTAQMAELKQAAERGGLGGLDETQRELEMLREQVSRQARAQGTASRELAAITGQLLRPSFRPRRS